MTSALHQAYDHWTTLVDAAGLQTLQHTPLDQIRSDNEGAEPPDDPYRDC